MTCKESLFNSINKNFYYTDRALCKEVYQKMFMTRFLDYKMGVVIKQNKGTTFCLSVYGHELIGAVSGTLLKKGVDWAFPYHRDRAFVIGLTASTRDLIRSFLAREGENHSGGRMMPDHFSDKKLRIPCQSSVVGSQLLQAVGTAKSIRIRKKNEIVYVSLGDGATSQGDFHEALNFSSIHHLPILFVVQDNGWAISTPIEEQTAGGSIASVVKGYPGIKTVELDGSDYVQTVTGMHRAIRQVRNEGPVVVIAKVPRIAPHSCSDNPKVYKPAELIEKELKNDPFILFENWLIEEGIFEKEEIGTFQKEIKQTIEKEFEEEEKAPFAKPEHLKVFKDFYFTSQKSVNGEKMTMADAINRALIEEMEKDNSVLVFGEDVAKEKGGVFKITKDLTEKFGDDRCFNTPLAESTIIGTAIGLSFNGLKPVAEIQYADYVWTGMNQIVNELSSIYFRSNGAWNCPVVVRMTIGGYVQGGPYHSQSIESVFTHFPGLKIAYPSNASDAKALLKTAIRDPNPVLFFEHKLLYRDRIFSMNEVGDPESCLEFGKANILHKGSDLTVVAWGYAAKTAALLAKEIEDRISIEVIDLRTLVPYDKQAILQSLKKTGKVLIFHEAIQTSGFGSELAAMIAKEGFYYLDAPIERVCAKDFPVPYAKNLEDYVLPQKEDLYLSIKKMHNF